MSDPWYDDIATLQCVLMFAAIILVVVGIGSAHFFFTTIQVRANLATLETVCKANALKEPKP